MFEYVWMIYMFNKNPSTQTWMVKALQGWGLKDQESRGHGAGSLPISPKATLTFMRTRSIGLNMIRTKQTGPHIHHYSSTYHPHCSILFQSPNMAFYFMSDVLPNMTGRGPPISRTLDVPTVIPGQAQKAAEKARELVPRGPRRHRGDPAATRDPP